LNILFVTEKFERGGLETNITTYACYLSNKGNRVYLASPAGSNLALLQDYLTGTVSITEESSLLNNHIADNIKTIRRYIKDQEIDYVIVEPFISFFYGSLAAGLEGVPYCLFFHGPSSTGLVYGDFFAKLLHNFILPYSDRVFAVSKETDFEIRKVYPDAKVTVLLNPVDLQKFKVTATNSKDWTIISRLDNDKLNSILNVVNLFDKAAPNIARLNIVGTGNAVEQIKQYTQNLACYKKVDFKDYLANPAKIMSNSKVIFGMGRVVLEAIACNRTVILSGYDGLKGIIDPALFTKAAWANFSGRNLATVTPETILSEMKKHTKISPELRNMLENNYSLEVVAESLISALRSVSGKIRPIPKNQHVFYDSIVNSANKPPADTLSKSLADLAVDLLQNQQK